MNENEEKNEDLKALQFEDPTLNSTTHCSPCIEDESTIKTFWK